MQHLSKIGQSAAELWPKNIFSIWPPSAILNFKKLTFSHVAIIAFQICYCVPNFIKIRRFLDERWRFNDYKDGGRPPS